METLPDPLRWGMFVLAIVSALTDLRNRTIPNWLTLPITLYALGARWYLGGWPFTKIGLFGFAAGFGVYYLFFLVGGRGGGDVKLMGAYGALMGALNWIVLGILTGILAGIVAVIMIIAKGRSRQTWANIRGIGGKDRVTLDSRDALALPHGTVTAVPALLMAWAFGIPPVH
ncbi:MAG TPA: A24 family peptidase [Bryobacteraceae bacterium]|nr:A24 family peptidase [Bryobacteraceae bacterium]